MTQSKLKALGAVITITIAILSNVIVYSAGNTDKKEVNPFAGLTLEYDLDTIGRISTLADVSQMKLSQPDYLPLGTSLDRARILNDSIAVLMFTNPHLKRIDGYEQDVQIVILAQKDGTSFATYRTRESKPIVTIIENGTERTVDIPVVQLVPNRSRIVSVAGNLGSGYDPIEIQGWHDKGKVQWWSEGIHYQILANLPLNELIRIAESMTNN